MKKSLLFIACLVILPLRAQNVSNYYSKYVLLTAPPAAFNDGLLGFANPAMHGMMTAPDMRFYWTTDGPKSLSFNNWALMTTGGPFGFGMYQQNLAGKRLTDYSLSFGGGTEAFSIGFAYDWANGDRTYFSRQSLVKASAIVRPLRQLSIGVTGFWGLDNGGQEGLVELGFRPFGTPRLTLFGDALFGQSIKFADEFWSAGAALQVSPGINIVGRYFGNEAFTVGLALDFGGGSFAAQSHYGGNGDHGYNSYMLRSGGFKNNIFHRAAKKKAYVPLSLTGTVDYQKFFLFDDNTQRFYDLLRDIRASANDPRIAVIAVNQTGLLIRPEHAWEVRQELKAAREKGKKVVAYIETAGLTGYYLASVADEVVMDPQGMLTLPGLVMGRTYFKGALEKLGIGFDEWRFYTHKTAMESLSRESLSDADKEQYNAYLDVWYNLLQTDVSASRQLTKEEFDAAINESIVFSGNMALEKKLVDRLDRWSNIDNIIKEMNDNRGLLKMRRGQLWDNAVLPETWGEKPCVALVYGIGDCAMDSGIRARFLERVFDNIAKDKSIQAVVFRVDSPGGSGLASDMVTQALKKCAEKKPVIVSQGQVAGSGGYWISLYGDKILAGPNTITGSIGVIGGWLWDKGFSEKLGLSADFVKRGEHADAEYGVTLPLLGLTLPARNLTDDERAKIEKWIRGHYDEFITKVAEGRGKTKEEVDKIGQGRFYSGLDGKKIGLVDDIGGLMMALDLAKQDAGIDPNGEYEIVEIPRSLGLLSFLELFAPLDRVAAPISRLATDPVIRYIKMQSENPYQPLDMLPPGTYPEAEK